VTILAAGPIPLYHQLERAVIVRISGGHYAAGDALPSEQELGREFGVSRITVRKALDSLTAQGLVVRRRGVGSFVAERTSGVHAIHLSGSLDEFLLSASDLRPRVLSLGMARAADDMAAAFGLPSDSDLLRLELVSSGEDGPIAHCEFFFHPATAERFGREDIGHDDPIVRIVERKLGKPIARAVQLIEPDVASKVTAGHLGIRPGTPVLRTRRSYYTAAGELVEVAQLHHHPHRYRYEVELRSRAHPL